MESYLVFAGTKQNKKLHMEGLPKLTTHKGKFGALNHYWESTL